MIKEPPFIQLNIKNIKNDFSTYQLIEELFFDKEKMEYSMDDYYKLIECSIEDIDINRNTFYSNRKKFIQDFQKSFDYTSQFTHSKKYFLKRLELGMMRNIIFDPPKAHRNEKESHLMFQPKVTKTFFPLYIGIIYNHSTINNWNTARTNIINCCKNNFSDDALFKITSYDPNHLKHLYEYWLNLTFPENLYAIIEKLDVIFTKDKGQFSHYASRHNIGLILHEITQKFFRSITIQNLYYDTIYRILVEILENDKEGFSITSKLMDSFPPDYSKIDYKLYNFLNNYYNNKI